MTVHSIAEFVNQSVLAPTLPGYLVVQLKTFFSIQFFSVSSCESMLDLFTANRGHPSGACPSGGTLVKPATSIKGAGDALP